MPSVGDILAAERRRQGKSIHDVVEGTKIRSRLVDALENGRYDDLPSSAYVKGYIMSYARYLEIPAEPLLIQFKREYGDHQMAPRPTDKYLGMSSANLKQLPADTVVPHREQAHAIPPTVWAAVAALVIIVLLLVCGITRSCTSSEPEDVLPTPATETSSEVTAAPGPTEEPTETLEPTTTVETATSTFKLRVAVRAGQASWMQITVDGLRAFEGTLSDGNSREWLVSEKAIVKVGRPDVVTVTKDGEAVKLKFVSGTGVATLSADE